MKPQKMNIHILNEKFKCYKSRQVSEMEGREEEGKLLRIIDEERLFNLYSVLKVILYL